MAKAQLHKLAGERARSRRGVLLQDATDRQPSRSGGRQLDEQPVVRRGDRRLLERHIQPEAQGGGARVAGDGDGLGGAAAGAVGEPERAVGRPGVREAPGRSPRARQERPRGGASFEAAVRDVSAGDESRVRVTGTLTAASTASGAFTATAPEYRPGPGRRCSPRRSETRVRSPIRTRA